MEAHVVVVELLIRARPELIVDILCRCVRSRLYMEMGEHPQL